MSASNTKTCRAIFNSKTCKNIFKTCNNHQHQGYSLTSSRRVSPKIIPRLLLVLSSPPFVTTRRGISSLLHKTLIRPPSSPGTYSNNNNNNNKNPFTSNVFYADVQNAISLVRKYDPSGYLPGLLLPSKDARLGYFAIRAFWIESGLRFKSNPMKDSIASSKQIPGVGQRDILIPDHERIGYWKNAIDGLYSNNSNDSSSGSCRDVQGQHANSASSTLRLLDYIIQRHHLSKCYFDRIMLGRERDVDMKQYSTIQSLEDHVDMFCVSLLNLVLECGGVYHKENNDDDNTAEINTIIYNTARHVGLTHGLTNALRLSVPTASATGKVIVPQDLCTKYNIQSPRYLLSALGMGDQECKQSLQRAVQDIVMVAREHLAMAREVREDIAKHSSSSPMGDMALAAFLPALASETFLNRLEHHGYDLTDRTLRSVGMLEHVQCAQRLVVASWKKTF
jgi:Phytoene/squalene synthetase